MTDGLSERRERDYRDAVARLLAAHRARSPRAEQTALADAAYGAALRWSAAAGAWLAAAGWSDDEARRASARADSAIWDALSLGGGGGR